MNNLLKKLYENKWDALTNNVTQLKSKAASPLLIKVSDDYINSDLKVMVIGQETDGWFGYFNETQPSIEKLMDGYYDYFYKISKNGKKRSKRAFWNNKNFEFFEKSIKVEGKSVQFIWNNISKIGGTGRGKPKRDIWELEKSTFDVIRGEIEILKPDLIIFTTGSRDNYIKFHCGNETKFISKLYFEGNVLADKTNNLIAEVKMQHFPNTCAVRVQHPNRRALDNNVILNVIKQCWPLLKENS